MNITYTYLILLLVLACIVMPVTADEGNITNTTVITTNETTVVTTQTTLPPTTTTATTVATTVTTAVPTTTTAAPTTTTTTVPATTATTVVTITAVTTGDVFVASSPPGAAILIDGVYYGTTPGTVTALPGGNHMIRLSLSGYNDYEGTIYVIAGQSTSEYGTLHPMNTGPSQIIVATASLPPTTVVPETTAPPVTASSDNALESPTVIAALIGIVTAAIGAGATIFTHNAKTKTGATESKAEGEKKDGKE